MIRSDEEIFEQERAEACEAADWLDANYDKVRTLISVPYSYAIEQREGDNFLVEEMREALHYSITLLDFQRKYD